MGLVPRIADGHRLDEGLPSDASYLFEGMLRESHVVDGGGQHICESLVYLYLLTPALLSLGITHWLRGSFGGITSVWGIVESGIRHTHKLSGDESSPYGPSNLWSS